MMAMVQYVFPVQKVTIVRLARREAVQQEHFLALEPQPVTTAQQECSVRAVGNSPAHKESTREFTPHHV